jgi:hypothetical protein
MAETKGWKDESVCIHCHRPIFYVESEWYGENAKSGILYLTCAYTLWDSSVSHPPEKPYHGHQPDKLVYLARKYVRDHDG